MKKYKFDNFKVIENSTSFVIQICKTKDAAKKLAAKLNSGYGFDGETPKFFVYAKDQK